MKIAFWEAKNDFDPQVKTSTPYRQLKSYLLFHSDYKEIIDMNYCRSINEITFDTDVIAVSGSSQNFFEIIEFGKEIKKKYPDVFLLLGGHHISTLPDTLPIEFDAGVLFEGEKTFKEIIDNLIKYNMNKSFFQSQKGIVFHDNNIIKINENNDSIDNLDTIPFPVIEDDEPPYLFTSRGCPYKCSFCYSSSFWKKVRYFTSDYVISEIDYIIKNFPQLKNIVIWDDLVLGNKERFFEIINKIEKKESAKKISFGFAVKANLIDDEICSALNKINISHVSFGAESGNDRVLKILKGENSSVSQNQKAIDILNKYNIPVACGFVIGAPTETRNELQETFDFIMKNTKEKKIVVGIVNILMPLPGTKMWEYGIENKIITKPYNWNRFKLFVSYRASNIKSIEDWVKKRLDLNCYYLNEKEIPHNELLELLMQFEKSYNKILFNQI